MQKNCIKKYFMVSSFARRVCCKFLAMTFEVNFNAIQLCNFLTFWTINIWLRLCGHGSIACQDQRLEPRTLLHHRRPIFGHLRRPHRPLSDWFPAPAWASAWAPSAAAAAWTTSSLRLSCLERRLLVIPAAIERRRRRLEVRRPLLWSALISLATPRPTPTTLTSTSPSLTVSIPSPPPALLTLPTPTPERRCPVFVGSPAASASENVGAVPSRRSRKRRRRCRPTPPSSTTSSSSTWRLWPRSTTCSGIFCRWTSRCRAVSRTCQSQFSPSSFWQKNLQKSFFWSFNSSEWKTKLKRTLSRQKGWIFFFSVETSFIDDSSSRNFSVPIHPKTVHVSVEFGGSGSQILQLALNDWNKTTWN